MRERGAWGWFRHDITHRGITAWALFVVLLLFYFLLYFPDKFSEGARVLGASRETIEAANAWGTRLNVFEDAMRSLGGAVGASVREGWDPLWNKWTLYGLLYTLAITIGGAVVLKKYAHDRYQVVRIITIIAVQIVFAFTLPIALGMSGHKDYYFSYFWPLKIEYMYPETLVGLPVFMALYSVIGAVVLVPLLGALFGKRWYCAWICGCGGLANTFGDPWRRLSDKSQRAWTFEKYAVHSMLIIALVTTGLVATDFVLGDASPRLGAAAAVVKFLYGVFGVALLSGAVGVAFYPIGGTRVWCRYFCPMAALLGLVQKFGRYRITVKEGMCISCGLCSTYCEMGIDVRSYAQRDQSFVRAACVGCGLCAEVCPRGVLRLEMRADRDPQELSMRSLLSETYKQEPHRRAV